MAISIKTILFGLLFLLQFPSKGQLKDSTLYKNNWISETIQSNDPNWMLLHDQIIMKKNQKWNVLYNENKISYYGKWEVINGKVRLSNKMTMIHYDFKIKKKADKIILINSSNGHKTTIILKPYD